MPDLIVSSEDEAPQLQVWPHEICASCTKQAECPLLAMLQQYRIQTYTGMTIFRCAQYNPDETSPHYIPQETREPDVLMAQQMQQAEAETGKLLAELAGVQQSIWSSSSSFASRAPARPTKQWPRKLGQSTHE